MTLLGRRLLALGLIAMMAGILSRRELVAFSGLALVLWLLINWALFRFRISRLNPLTEGCQRFLDGSSLATVSVMWGQPVDVRCRWKVPRRLRGLRCEWQELVPTAFERIDGHTQFVGDLNVPEPIELQYRLQPRSMGKFSLRGWHVVFSDPQGCFQVRRFIPVRQDINVFPYMVRPQATVSVLKPNNIQILTGIHRHRRSGFSAELLGIRDYQPGDPPRNLAWKATARLGRLMTCEYESEVPVRATLYTDLSAYQFTGRPGRAPADQVLSAAASIARLLIADHDPVACYLIAGGDRQRIASAHGERQLTRLVQQLVGFESIQANAEHLSWTQLTEVTWLTCYQLYPELFESTLNPEPRFWFPKSYSYRRRQTQRVQLARVLAYLSDQASGWSIRLRHDGTAFRQACVRFLESHPVCEPIPPKLGGTQALIALNQRTLQSVEKALLESLARAHDNELFVLILASPHPSLDLNPLQDVIRLARAKYHRVIVIDVGQSYRIQEVQDPTARRILESRQTRSTSVRPASPWSDALQRLGVKIASIDDPELIEIVAREVELLKYGRARHQSVGGVRR